MSSPPNESQMQKLVRLRLAPGRYLVVFWRVLHREPHSLLVEMAQQQRRFVDCTHRDPLLVRLLVDTLRNCLDDEGRPVRKFVAPEEFGEWRQLSAEASYWRMDAVEKLVQEATPTAGTIVVGYHGSLATGGRSGTFSGEVNFRRIDRVLVSGKAKACREVFGKHLNETRDQKMDSAARYSSRFYLNHAFLEQAFDTLALHGYKLVSSNSATPRYYGRMGKNGEHQQMEIFSHYTQYVFVKSNDI